ncbi:MAG TPA: DUF1080 domain-containing protein [Chitinophagaceae bacterium]|nr:DUF1080 domain-containing protein [Chitinophagaceae bacterium]HUM64471.1 DUF1080 domain-containing protein [Chitinophagaceae bacterium]
MKRIITLAFLLVAIGGLAQKQIKPRKWVKLFNGKNLDGWTVKIKDYPVNENFGNTFRVENGAIQVSYDQYDGQFKERFGHMFYKEKFSAYLLVVEYRFIGDQISDGPGWAFRNSGMMLHGQSPETMALDQDFPISMEAQLLGGNGKDNRSTNNLCTPGTNVVMDGKLFTPHCVNSSSKTYHGDQWVTAQVLVLGDSIVKHIVEKDTVLGYGKPQYDGNDKWVKQAGLKDGELISEGTISLQSESHPVEFRKVELLDLAKYMNKPKKLKKVLELLKNR